MKKRFSEAQIAFPLRQAAGRERAGQAGQHILFVGKVTGKGATMTSIPSILSLVHILGLVSGVGCATAKLTLLLKCKADQQFLPAYLAAAKPLTRLIILGLVLLTLSGIGWLLVGYGFSPRLIVKLALVGTIWIIGPIIDNLVEPKLRNLAPQPGEQASSTFLQIQRRYLLLEIVATGLFYVIILVWILA